MSFKKVWRLGRVFGSEKLWIEIIFVLKIFGVRIFKD
jgi:hypothetical protein